MSLSQQGVSCRIYSYIQRNVNERIKCGKRLILLGDNERRFVDQTFFFHAYITRTLSPCHSYSQNDVVVTEIGVQGMQGEGERTRERIAEAGNLVSSQVAF